MDSANSVSGVGQMPVYYYFDVTAQTLLQSSAVQLWANTEHNCILAKLAELFVFSWSKCRVSRR